MPNHARLPLWDAKSDPQKIETLHTMLLDLYRYQLADVYANVRENLLAHQPSDEKEQRDIQMILRLMDENPNIINMNCEVGHFTASEIVVDVTTNKTLLHFHKKLNNWFQVGGHADYEIDMSKVAMREATEETGLPDLAHYPHSAYPKPIDYDVHTFPQRGDYPEHLHLDFRYVLTTTQPDALSPEDGESAQFKWLSFDEAVQLVTDDALKRLLRKTQNLFA